MSRLLQVAVLAAAISCTAAAPGVQAAAEPSPVAYDLVFSGGRVMDPASGLDAVRHVAVQNGRIAAISEAPLLARDTVDVSGHVVAPGFVDLHAHGQDLVSSGFQALDGVTTALEQEGGVFPVRRWYEARARQGAIINYGASVSHGGARGAALAAGADQAGNAAGAARPAATARPRALYAAATPAELGNMTALMTAGLEEGGLGFGFGINYTPGATPAEIESLFRTAASRKVPVFVHTRDFGLEAIREVVEAAERTGASLHIVHIGSSTTRFVQQALETIDSARTRGVDVTTEVYPYSAASTRLESAIFDDGWQAKLGISYGDIEVTATGERLTAESFARHRAQGAWVIIHMIPEQTVTRALAHPGVMVASDGVPFVDGRAHPRGAGTFARVLGRYVREQQTLTLMDALARMTILPARRLEPIAPAMRSKGRLQVGADADITVFDPARVLDRATFAQPAQGSAGIPYVLVNGTFVVRDGRLVPDARPGRAITAGVAPAPTP
jgi:N-acyl-D-aspartate/D-glutamate deacylase